MAYGEKKARESRLSHVRGRVPRGVIGEHALEHLKDTEAFADPEEECGVGPGGAHAAGRA